MTPVSGSVRFMQIFAGFPGEGASHDSGVIENVDFQGFRILDTKGRTVPNSSVLTAETGLLKST